MLEPLIGRSKSGYCQAPFLKVGLDGRALGRLPYAC